MDRRMFLKSVGIGAVHPGSLLAMGPALMRQGNRELKDITAAEIEELLVWCKIDLASVVTVESCKEEDLENWTGSLHPIYQATYHNGDDCLGPHISLNFWHRTSCEYNEWDTTTLHIEVGEIWAGCGPLFSAPEMVKWFLDHGFRVW